MDKHELAVMRGEEAERLLNSDMLQQAFADTRQALQKTWTELPTGYFTGEMKAAHHDLHRMMKLLGMVEACLRKHIETGKVSRKHIESVAKQGLLRRVG